MSGIIIHTSDPVPPRITSVELTLSPDVALAVTYLLGETVGHHDEINGLYSQLADAFGSRGIQAYRIKSEDVYERAQNGQGYVHTGQLLAAVRKLIAEPQS